MSDIDFGYAILAPSHFVLANVNEDTCEKVYSKSC